MHFSLCAGVGVGQDAPGGISDVVRDLLLCLPGVHRLPGRTVRVAWCFSYIVVVFVVNAVVVMVVFVVGRGCAVTSGFLLFKSVFEERNELARMLFARIVEGIGGFLGQQTRRVTMHPPPG